MKREGAESTLFLDLELTFDRIASLEHTDAELHYYLKDARPGAGYGEIACQTVARYHVDNCEELDETPGSGLGRAVREAAWQFLVLPPRVGGHLQVGAWVRIRITYSERKEHENP